VHVVRRLGYEPGRLQYRYDLLLYRVLPQFFNPESGKVARRFGEEAGRSGLQLYQFLEGILTYEVKVMYPFGDAGNLDCYAAVAHQVYQFAYRKIVTPDVDFSDYEHPGQVGQIPLERNLLYVTRDAPKFVPDFLRMPLYGFHHTLP